MMLSLRLRLRDLNRANWGWSNGRWSTGRSEICPFDHPGLACSLWTDRGGRGAVLVQEQLPNQLVSHRPQVVADARRALSQARTMTGEYLELHWQPGRFELTAGPLGRAPLLLAARGECLLASWHLPALASLIDPDHLLGRAVARRLARQPRYTSDTVFPGVHRLTERATATFTRSGLSLNYPEPAEHVLRPRQLRAGADVIHGFSELVTDILAGGPAALAQVGVELSGGADSANVALTLAAIHDRPVSSYGLILDREVGQQQRLRRRAMIGCFNLRDTTIAAADHPPFGPTGVRGRHVPHDPTAAYYREAFDALRDAVLAGDTRVICSGLGGDELMSPPSTRRPPVPVAQPLPWLGPTARKALAEVDINVAPVPAAPMTALMAQASHHPAYLDAGIWPVAPLAHPALLRFSEQLPLTWRDNKRLLRDRLRRAGLAEDVVTPSLPETFSALMQAGLRRHGLPILKAMLDESVLVEVGYLDRAALAAVYEDAQHVARLPSMLCDALALETGLRSLHQAGCQL